MDKKLLWWIFGVTKGGIVRLKIIRRLKERPANANQLAQELGLDYTTIRYHLDILLKHKILVSLEQGYSRVYFLSEEMEKDYSTLLEISQKIER